mgnify:CR=1 FL=1
METSARTVACFNTNTQNQTFHPIVITPEPCVQLLLCGRQDAFTPVDLNPLILTGADNANRAVPAHTEDLDSLSTYSLSIRFTLLFQASPSNRIHALTNNTVLVRLRSTDIPDSTCTVVTTTDETVAAVGIAGQRNHGIGVTSEGHGGDGCR